MRQLILVAALLCVGIGASITAVAQTTDASSRVADITAHNGLDGSAYVSLRGSYSGEMAAEIQKKWDSIVQSERTNASGTTIIDCTISKKGTIGKVEATTSSGDRSLDDAAIVAAKAAAPLKEVPRQFKGAKFRLFFFYNLPSTKDRPACNSMRLAP
jgi:TonB family protein